MTVVLSMTVGSEEHVVERALRSALPYVDAWCVHCNGDDATADVVRRVLGHLPGELVENEWVDQEHNRNLALEHARKLGDYVLAVDADEYFEAEADFAMPALDLDFYELTVRYRSIEFARCALMRSALPWRWVGKRHPKLVAAGARTRGPLDGLWIVATPSGQSWSDPDKYKKHVEQMTAVVAAAPRDPRQRYYLAQSCRDAMQLERAVGHYVARSHMGGFDEERWSALLETAKCQERLGRPVGEVADAYLAAHRARPTRAEAAFHLGRYLARRGHRVAALRAAQLAVSIPRPPDRLFVEWQIYASAARELHDRLAAPSAP